MASRGVALPTSFSSQFSNKSFSLIDEMSRAPCTQHAKTVRTLHSELIPSRVPRFPRCPVSRLWLAASYLFSKPALPHTPHLRLPLGTEPSYLYQTLRCVRRSRSLFVTCTYKAAIEWTRKKRGAIYSLSFPQPCSISRRPDRTLTQFGGCRQLVVQVFFFLFQDRIYTPMHMQSTTLSP